MNEPMPYIELFIGLDSPKVRVESPIFYEMLDEQLESLIKPALKAIGYSEEVVNRLVLMAE